MSHLKSALVSAFAFLMTTQAAVAAAAEREPFSANAFAAAQAAGRPIVVDVAANWCPICHAQEPILDKLSTDPRFAQLVIFNLDFDAQRDAWRKLGVRQQSTLIAFHGARETARSVGDTDPGSIGQLLAASLR
jgi:thiol-disulfide isomerase/thioredoxin